MNMDAPFQRVFVHCARPSGRLGVEGLNAPPRAQHTGSFVYNAMVDLSIFSLVSAMCQHIAIRLQARLLSS